MNLKMRTNTFYACNCIFMDGFFTQTKHTQFIRYVYVSPVVYRPPPTHVYDIIYLQRTVFNFMNIFTLLPYIEWVFKFTAFVPFCFRFSRFSPRVVINGRCVLLNEINAATIHVNMTGQRSVHYCIFIFSIRDISRADHSISYHN